MSQNQPWDDQPTPAEATLQWHTEARERDKAALAAGPDDDTESTDPYKDGRPPAVGFYSQNCRNGLHPTPDVPPPCAGCDCDCHAANPTRLARISDILPIPGDGL